jgi:hypothetical protein
MALDDPIPTWMTVTEPKEDAGLLTVLDGIQRAARDWSANNRATSWLAHNAERLKAANRLVGRPDLSAKLEPNGRSLPSCVQ